MAASYEKNENPPLAAVSLGREGLCHFGEARVNFCLGSSPMAVLVERSGAED
jgi:hypothetical protein